MALPSLSWIKQIRNLAQTEMVPQWGHTFDVDFDHLGKELAKIFSLDHLEIKKIRGEWLEAEEQLSGLGTQFSLFAIEASPVKGQCFLVMSHEDRKKWIATLLHTAISHKNFTDPRLEEGYLTFSILKTLRLIDQLAIFPGCSLHLVDAHPLPKLPAFCMEFSLSHKEHTFIFRLLCPQGFSGDFRTFFLSQKLQEKVPKTVTLPVSCIIGSTTLSISEWKSAETGDMLVLDRCSYDPDTCKGSVEMLVAGKSILHARIKPGGLKIIDFNDFFEDEPMTNDDLSPSDEENFSIEDDELKELEEAPKEIKVKKDTSKETLASLSHIPMVVHVEIAKFPLTLEKLLQLSSGNVLELNIQPEQSVNLVVNGKSIAKGEIVKVGDVLGVKIVKMGES